MEVRGGSSKLAQIFGEPDDLQSKSLKVEEKSEELSDAQKSYIKKQNVKNVAVKVGVTAGAVIFSPALLAVGGVFALSKLLSKDKNLADFALSKLILPAAYRKDIPDKLPETEGVKHVKFNSDGNELDGMLFLASGLEAENAKNMPCVVIFCTNNGSMTDEFNQKEAKEFQENGFNVVLFNYRGVGDSQGKPVSTEDLKEDGLNVVNQLLNEGLSMNEDVTFKPDAKNVILSGTSIGGAVAAHVGGTNPESVLAISRSFTTWRDAAEGYVKDKSNIAFAKFAKFVLSKSDKTDLDNVTALKSRLEGDHNITIIESAGREGKGDDFLAAKAKLTESYIRSKLGEHDPVVEYSKLSGQNYVKFYDGDDAELLIGHNSRIYPQYRTELMEKVLTPHRIAHQELKEAADLKNEILALEKSPPDKLLPHINNNFFEVTQKVRQLTDKLDQDSKFLTQIETEINAINIRERFQKIRNDAFLQADVFKELEESIQALQNRINELRP